MCLGIPMKVIEKESLSKAFAEYNGVKRAIYIDLVPDIKLGDYVLVHAGFAMEIIDTGEALERIKLFEEIFAEEENL